MRGATRVPAGTPVLLDAHAHYYSCFSAARFLDHAAANFARSAAAAGLAPGAPAFLVIASTSRGDGFAELRERCNAGRAGPWRVTPTDEEVSLLASRAEHPEIVLLAGRQVITAERLEVLALACTAPIPNGLSLNETVRAARSAGAIVVLPWGFGKWSLARGKAVRRFLGALGSGGGRGDGDQTRLFLGDTANRPRSGLREPAILRDGRARGLHVLPGTDPLPLGVCEGTAGGYGCIINIPFDASRPGAALRDALANSNLNPVPFGRRLPLAGFIRTQAALRLPGRPRPAPDAVQERGVRP